MRETPRALGFLWMLSKVSRRTAHILAPLTAVLPRLRSKGELKSWSYRMASGSCRAQKIILMSLVDFFRQRPSRHNSVEPYDERAQDWLLSLGAKIPEMTLNFNPIFHDRYPRLKFLLFEISG